MKMPIALVVGAALLSFTVFAQAQDARPAASPGKSGTAPSMSMMMQMDEHMKKMQALHDKVTSAATPEEREKAMQAARKEMQDGMATMKPMMQGGGMMGGAMGGRTQSGDTQQQMQMMDKRMDMMQMMMQLMMQQQGMTAAPKASSPAPTK